MVLHLALPTACTQFTLQLKRKQSAAAEAAELRDVHPPEQGGHSCSQCRVGSVKHAKGAFVVHTERLSTQVRLLGISCRR